MECQHMQGCLGKLGLLRVCFTCGVPGDTEGVELSVCAQCKAAFYCSRECQKRDWKAGHKLDCASVQSALKGATARTVGGEQFRPARK